MERIEVGFDQYYGHWWYRVRGTNLTDCGYKTPEEASECAQQRYKLNGKRQIGGSPQ